MSVPESGTSAVGPPTLNTPPATATSRARGRRMVAALFPLAAAVGCVAGLVVLGQANGWKLLRASAGAKAATDDWCKEHGVPESGCVECRPGLLPRGPAFGWCETHGVSECPHCHPDAAHRPADPATLDADRARALRALAFAPRPANDEKCQKHVRRLQLVSGEMADRLGLGFARVERGPVSETITAPGEVGYDPTRLARVTPRTGGTVWSVEKQVGDKVARGELLALVESAEVGRAKGEFQQAVFHLALKRETLANLLPMAGTTVPHRDVQAAEAAAEEAEVRALAAEQALANLGLPIRVEDVRGLSPADLDRRTRFLGLPAPLAAELVGRTGSSNLLPVTAPLAGEVVARTAAKDQAADPARPLFVVADTDRVWLTLRVRSEDAGRVKPGQAVRFRHAGHAGPVAWDAGVVVSVSPAADEKTRTVPVRVDLTNPADRHRANTFGTAEVVLRDEADAVVVPAGAVHWEGCCHVVFVRDKDYERPGAPKVVHVRKVRPGATDVPTAAGPVTEVAAGLLPGEWVATTNSGVFRSELLKNDLGAG